MSVNLYAMDVIARDDADILLLTINVPGNPIRLTDHAADVTSNGSTFSATGIQIDLPQDVHGQRPEVRLVVPNVGNEAANLIEQVHEPVPMVLELVSSGDPDAILKTVRGLSLVRASVNMTSSEWFIEAAIYGDEPLTNIRVTEDRFPGVACVI